ncbi:MAG: hypothetical protein JJU37_07000 [Balneolaceae bacterium]|nr:hypothetical protein [Balneolaceae bacterium]
MKVQQIFTAVVLSLSLFISCSTKSNPVYTLTTSTDPAASGTVMPSQGGFDEGSEVEITASANENMVFSGWRGDYTGSDNPTVVTMNRDINIIAFFIDRKYPLSILIEGEGTVNERVLEERSTEYNHETFVELTAKPAEGWKLAEWRGDLSGSINPVVIKMDETKEVTAVFVKREYPLTITIEGEGSVAEQVIQEKSTDYEYSSHVELTAHSADGWIFSGWDGDLEGNENPETIIINQPTNVTAIFIPVDELLTLTVHGEGTVDIEQIEPDDNSLAAVFQLTARASDSWRFAEWTGDVTSTENPVQIMLDEEKTVHAVFEIREYPLTIHTDGEGTVAEQVIQKKSSNYEDGTVVELTANANQGWKFIEWQGDLSGSENPKQITIDNPKEVTAVFTEESDDPEESTFELTVNLDGEGSVNVDPEQDEYEDGSTVELTATPSDGWEFVEWTGDINSARTSVEITMDTDKEVTAVFSEEPEEPEESRFDLTVNVEGEGSVSVDPEQDEYEDGSTVELTATPSDGWEFVEWAGDVNSSQTSVEITMDADKEVTAVFEEILFDLTINITGNGTVNISPELNEYESGTVVELTANPSDGWEFGRWEGDLTGTENPFSVTMESSTEITALFIEQETAFSGGDGSAENPFQVSTAEQLQTISEFLSSHFIQVNHIDAGSTSGWNGRSGFSPIGSSSNPFTGTFNGNGFEISGLTIDRDGDVHVGMFGVTGSAQIMNIGLVSVNITGEDNVGGLAGINNGQISNSYVTGNVTGDKSVGGLVGINNGQITGSHSEATVTGDDDYIGGLVGINSSEISRSFATGSVSGDESVGGLVGANRNGAQIVNSYATGSVSGDDEIGGFVGRNWRNGVIATSFASGSVSGDEHTGGFIGRNQSSLDSCYWDNLATNQSSGTGRGTERGLTGLTTSEMTGSSAEENMPGFDWSNVWRTSGNYPVLQ